MALSGGIGQEFIAGVFNHAERLLIIINTDRCFRKVNGRDLAYLNIVHNAVINFGCYPHIMGPLTEGLQSHSAKQRVQQ